MSLLKLLLFGLILLLMAVTGFYSYRWLNRKIVDSNTLIGLLGYAVLLVIINLLVLFGATTLLLISYGYLFDDMS